MKHGGRSVSQPSGSAVFVVTDGRAILRIVRTGLADVRNVEIVDGVRAGERVIVVGQAALRDGQVVSVSGSAPKQ
jgi:multidrug efflux pump subunit AcrA (membrane-fusion protein)